MNINKTMIIHCPERNMAFELTKTIHCNNGHQAAINGWDKYKENTCYGIQTEPKPEILFFGSLEDDYLRNKDITEFVDWKKDSIRKKVEERVLVYMCLGDIEDACHEQGIKLTKNRANMEMKLIDAMVQEALTKEV